MSIDNETSSLEQRASNWKLVDTLLVPSSLVREYIRIYREGNLENKAVLGAVSVIGCELSRLGLYKSIYDIYNSLQ